MNTHDALLVRPPLSMELAEHIRSMIMAGDLKDDQKVPEKALCERFGVSRTPLREALKILSAEGYIQLVPNRGARVCGLTVEEVEQGFPVIATLEGLSGELAVKFATDAEIAAIADMNARMRVAYEAGDLTGYFELNQAIHHALLDAARNPILSQHHRMLSQRMRRARFISNISPVRWRKAMEEHDLILDALHKRDGERLSRILKRHLEAKIQTVKAAILAAQQGTDY
ncbi:GntR family transcriptional regulator [Acuticoccus sp. I52.16.1]|uniref:GntR family transcriptional regulator n=1 Tax=Acuticoccus sp. I52.16.1 TaxID=2928472 RepID=UPI001FCFA4F5|nr:GntR family transcriptional regulator [Acuticoccus sp. I52.16.1]UOM33777.1 GntR family transcriptional regulator [Acuticoccus sp. I52.16.1]